MDEKSELNFRYNFFLKTLFMRLLVFIIFGKYCKYCIVQVHASDDQVIKSGIQTQLSQLNKNISLL